MVVQRGNNLIHCRSRYPAWSKCTPTYFGKIQFLAAQAYALILLTNFRVMLMEIFDYISSAGHQPIQ